MPNLTIDVKKFSGSYTSINAKKQLPITEEQALHAAISVGTPLLKKGTASAKHALAMAAYKAVAIKATIDFDQKNLVGFNAYRQLDPSEKTNLSYWIGMVFTALLARELIGVEQLLHAACFNKRRIGKTSSSSKSLADLIGRDSTAHWHVFEAKGRQKKVTQPDRVKWKQQSETINSIGGKTPKTRSFCVAMIGSNYRAELEDPAGNNGTVEIEFVKIRGKIRQQVREDDALIEAYYGPLLDVLKQSSTQIIRGNLTFLLIRVAFDAVTDKHVFVGMEDMFFQSLLQGIIPVGTKSVTGSDFYFGSDGIVTLTSTLCIPV